MLRVEYLLGNNKWAQDMLANRVPCAFVHLCATCVPRAVAVAECISACASALSLGMCREQEWRVCGAGGVGVLLGRRSGDSVLYVPQVQGLGSGVCLLLYVIGCQVLCCVLAVWPMRHGSMPCTTTQSAEGP